MTAAIRAARHVHATALLLATAVVVLWAAGSAQAALIEHQQVVGGLHGATLEARVDPEATATDCQAQYVSQAQFESSGWGAAATVPCEPAELGSGTEPVVAKVRIEGLALSTAYRYRFLLTTSGTTTPGSEGQFSTFGIESFSFRAIDAAKQPVTQAGAHPYELIVKITTPTTEVESGEPTGKTSPTGTIQNLLSELPPGLVGNPTAVPRCPAREAEEQTCTGDAQVGRLEVLFGEHTEANPESSALYNVIAPQGKAARFAGFVNASTDGFIDSGVRTGDDYGISSGGFNISGRANLFAVTVRLWGVPADPSHDAERICPVPGEPGQVILGCASSAKALPFLRNPTSCDGPLSVRAIIEAYQGPGEFDEATATMPAITGCEQLQFKPTIEVTPTNDAADSPTGLHVDLHVPQNEDPEGLATADLRDAVVKLPAGFVLNASSANGLAACTPAQFGLTTAVRVAPIHTTAAPATCPDAAKIGTVEIDSPLLDHPLPGAVYVAEPYENPFGSLLAIYIAVDDPISGVVVKLAGDIEIGPGGQLTTTFSNNPQLPFNDFKLDFFGGDLAALTTPDLCGNYATSSTLTPWSAPQSGAPVALTDTHPISRPAAGGACPTSATTVPNVPHFDAGSESSLAGAFTPFVVHLSRDDGSQRFSSLTVTPPPGLLGRLAGIPYCPDTALAAAAAKSGIAERGAPSCPQASRVGDVVVGDGSGPKPYYVPGAAYLAGPYKGAPLSLAIITPAVAGPYDLGTVVVRSALEVDPSTAQITVKSDPLPTELKGIPLDVRSIAVRMSRSAFTLNPTNCEALSVGGSVTTTVGQTAPLTNRFQARGCKRLPFKPRLALRVFGKTNRNAKPRFRAVLRAKPGEANIRRAQVNLPHSLFLEQAHIKTVCTRVQFDAGAGHGEQCPAGSIYGHAQASTSLLAQPLKGPVYLRSSSHKLPDLVAALNGQIDVALDGIVDSGKNDGLRTTFRVVPDAPVKKFILEMKGGKKGLLVNSENLCSKKARSRRAIVRFVGQNGKVEAFKPRVAAACGATKGK